jgi:hypothetical protein
MLYFHLPQIDYLESLPHDRIHQLKTGSIKHER